MQQCPTCKCQVGSGIAVCPYCGTQLYVEEMPRPSEGTYIRQSSVASASVPPPASASATAGNTTYRIPYYSAGVVGNVPVGGPVSAELPARYETSIYYSYPDRERNRSASNETVLLALLICMIVVNLFEFIALLVLML